jgi:hypothetical protein
MSGLFDVTGRWVYRRQRSRDQAKLMAAEDALKMAFGG